MILPFTFLLFKLKVIEPSERMIDLWKDTFAINKLEYALINGNYKTRQLAAEALEIIGEASSIPLLIKASNDRIHKVSIAALNALEAIGYSDQLIISITQKRFKWFKTIQRKEEQLKEKKQQKYNIYKWKRSSKKSFEMIKERLKRPIR
ncbi:MAG: HEAT repeat domain-containing protein [Winogradskyella sp.]|uniref:HEAT repeat domain-containing protein n=1 Tax=Winogradskyella sp. TaxID=1883156 RepID=UPI0025FA1FF6|nr:HEAT repeat domain-containing protein [Winogradskyella sp.]NRB83520.1 HEAT repeat domain-containing protein [Winogradskyella sp.]